MPVSFFLILAALLFSIAVYGVLARQHAVLVLLSIELMLNAVNINLVTFSALLENNLGGQIFALFIIAVAAAESILGLGIIMALSRRVDTVDVAEVTSLRE